MKKLLSRFGAKVSAVMLFVFFAAVLILSTAGIIALAAHYAYTDDGRYFKNMLVDDALEGYNTHVTFYIEDSYLFNNDSMVQYYEEYFLRENTNYLFTVKNEAGEILLSNQTNEATTRTDSYIQEVYEGDEMTQYYVETAVAKELSARDSLYYADKFGAWLVSARYTLIFLAILFFLIEVLLLIFICCSAGRRSDKEGIVLNFVDNIPLEVYAFSLVALVIFAVAVLEELSYTQETLFIIALFISGVASTALLCSVFYTLAARIKARTIFKNTLIYRILRLLKKAAETILCVARKIPLYWKTALVWVVLAAIEFIFMVFGVEDYIILWVIEKIVLSAVLVWLVLSMQRLKKAGREIADGNINYKVDTSYMLSDFKEHGENLNGIGLGLKRAVEQSVKSERMKAELIANVSHDIKTPLTSIVNYVDLLNRDGLSSDKAEEYLEVLNRQSARLKKLTEDLIEASKASTGNIKVEAKPLDVNVLLLQAVGEYGEKLNKKQLSVVNSFPKSATEIMADGKLLWRVFDNLLGNICKYSKEDTRVYISVKLEDKTVIITFKNISAEALEISGDELTERFVRGDTSRNTEGSGLGLSIAKSLVEIQGGNLSIDIDGDLFKTVIIFPII